MPPGAGIDRGTASADQQGADQGRAEIESLKRVAFNLIQATRFKLLFYACLYPETGSLSGDML